MLAAGEQVWESKAVCSWSSFLRALWEDRLLSHGGSPPLPSLMNPWQERFLWMRVLRGSPQGELLLNLPAASRLAAEAHKIVWSYELETALRTPPVAWEEETEAFLGWMESFLSICSQYRWLDASRLEAALSQALEGGELPPEVLPSALTLAGFTDLTPAQHRLLESFRRLGVAVDILEPAARETTAHWCRTVAKDSQSELRLAALWIRKILEEAPAGERPRIALVVPDLATTRSAVSRLLDEVLQPGFLLPHNASQESLYNLSLGQPLAAWPVVADALSLLELDGQWQPLPNLGVLFHSPFLSGAESERSARAMLEARFLRDGAFQVSLRRVLFRARQTGLEEPSRPTSCPLLAERLETVLEQLRTSESQLPPSRWAEAFKELLALYGWPGERGLDSAEFQTVVRWNELLAGLGLLDRVHPQMSRQEAVAALRRMAEETVYQPKMARGPVEVLGYLEAAGLPFDHLWLAGMHDAAWPQASRPNPYLPNSLQRAHGVPHSSAERELEFARRLTSQLLQSAPHGVVSCAGQEGDQPLRPSLLVEHLPERSPGHLPQAHVELLPQVLYESARVERVTDPGPPPVQVGRKSSGGTSIFKLQAACAFRAYASLRLHARPLQGVQAGLDPAQRGQLLHHVLEGFWKRARSSDALHLWEPERRDEVLSEAVEEALLAGKKERPDVLFGAFLDLERQRLAMLARQWLALEAERPPFVVRDTERAVEFEFGGVQLRAIIDRIDRLPDGSLVVIDYKTGSVQWRAWLGERPEDPQLPLYCVSSSEPIAALAFARVRAKGMGFSGISSSQDTLLPGLDPSEQAGDLGMSWEERQQQWRTVLERLAAEFHRGEFRVEPLSRNNTCRTCGLHTLCRIDEREVSL